VTLFPSLIPYGWNDLALPPGTTPARVTRHDGAMLTVWSVTGELVLRNTVDLDPSPTVGDWLALHGADAADPLAVRIGLVLERSSLLRRQSADDTGDQALAANVDVVLVTCGADRPIKAGRIDRGIAQARDAGATPIVVLTKLGAGDALPIDRGRLEREHPGVEVFLTSALEGEGIADLRAALANRTAVLLGESGAGKSTLTNAIVGNDAALTGEVRSGDAKGRHTTTSRQLHLIPGGGVIIDTPGIRSIGLAADADAIDATFADIVEWAEGCRFSDCAHGGEPGCAVREALDSGELSEQRYDSWRRLQREAASAAIRSDARARHQYARQFGRAARQGQEHKRGSKR